MGLSATEAAAVGLDALVRAPADAAASAGFACAVFLSSPGLASPPAASSFLLPPGFSASVFWAEGCDEWLCHSALLAGGCFFSIGTSTIAVASGAPVSLRLTPILKPGDVGPS